MAWDRLCSTVPMRQHEARVGRHPSTEQKASSTSHTARAPGFLLPVWWYQGGGCSFDLSSREVAPPWFGPLPSSNGEILGAKGSQVRADAVAITPVVASLPLC